VFQEYLKKEFEDFTSKFILARGIFQLLDKYDAKDFSEIENIEKYTDPKIKISLFKLDRVVNPTKGSFNTTEHKFTFIQNITSKKSMITLTEQQIQQYLCVAIRRVHEIVMKNMKSYKLEQSMDQGEDDDIDLELDNLMDK